MRPMWVAVVLSCCVVSLAQAQSPRLVGSAQFLVSTSRDASGSPCEDSLFLALRALPLDSLSTDEFAYVQDLTDQCAKSRRDRKLDPPLRGTGIAEWNSGSGHEDHGSGLAVAAIALSLVAIAVSVSVIVGLNDLFSFGK